LTTNSASLARTRDFFALQARVLGKNDVVDPSGPGLQTHQKL
jgi:hypothetical protein